MTRPATISFGSLAAVWATDSPRRKGDTFFLSMIKTPFLPNTTVKNPFFSNRFFYLSPNVEGTMQRLQAQDSDFGYSPIDYTIDRLREAQDRETIHKMIRKTLAPLTELSESK